MENLPLDNGLSIAPFSDRLIARFSYKVIKLAIIGRCNEHMLNELFIFLTGKYKAVHLQWKQTLSNK